MSITIGMSLGYLTGLETQEGTLAYMPNQGIKHCRVMEPFIKGFDSNVQKIADKIQFLIQKCGYKNVLISMGGIPHDTIASYDISKLNKMQMACAEYANRFPHKSPSMYEALLRNLVSEFDQRGILQSIDFELGHEPNSHRFFWGSFPEFKSTIEIRHKVLSETGRKLFIANFTSSLVRLDPGLNSDWREWIAKTPLLDSCGFSHGFYWKDSSGWYDPKFAFYPQRQFKEICISEYNISTSIRPGSAIEQEYNSERYVTRFFNLLKLFKDKPVSRIYIHCLTDFQRDKNGTMGLYKSKKFNYAKKPAADWFLKMWRVMDRGFTLMEDRIVGINEQIVFDAQGNWTIQKK